MTTTVLVTANAHKSSKGEQLECVVSTIDNDIEVRKEVVENGTTKSFAAFEGRSIRVFELVKE